MSKFKVGDLVYKLGAQVPYTRIVTRINNDATVVAPPVNPSLEFTSIFNKSRLELLRSKFKAGDAVLCKNGSIEVLVTPHILYGAIVYGYIKEADILCRVCGAT